MQNANDLNELTVRWHSDTNSLNSAVDDTFKSAQDHAYTLGLRRGREDAAGLIQGLRELHAKLNNEPLAAKEPGTSVDIGRAQITDELYALLTACGAN